MNVLVDIDDSSWLAIDNLEAEVQRIAEYCARAIDFGSEPMEAAILFTDDDSVAELNRTWRGTRGPTTVLSFPAPESGLQSGMTRHVGDIALAFGVVAREAQEQEKTLRDHTTHLLVHGLLHLAGHDHMTDAEAEIMVAREVAILQDLGIANPYWGGART